MAEFDVRIPGDEIIQENALNDTPKAPAAETPGERYRVAGFWVRALAFAIDLLAISAVNSVIGNLLPPVSTMSFGYKLFHINALFLGITGAAYFILMTYYFQQTLGKMIMGIKVMQRNGQKLSWLIVVFRELIARSLSQLLGLNLGYIVCWFNREKRCVHDFLSDTWVVYENQTTDATYITVGCETGS